MSDEAEFIAVGIIAFILGIMLIVSSPIDNLFTTFTGIKGDKLALVAILCIFGGPSLAIVAARSEKKSS